MMFGSGPGKKTLTVVTTDEQTQVFEGDKDEIATVRDRLHRLMRGRNMHVELVNRQGRTVQFWSNTIASIR